MHGDGSKLWRVDASEETEPLLPPVRVREARPTDLGRLLDLYRGPEGAYGGLEALSGEDAERRFGEVLADPRQRVLVAEEGAGVAGTLTLVLVPNLAHGGAPYAIVENVVVDGARRGSGVGMALLREAVSRAGAAGAYKLSLTANLSRKAAHGFYRSLGLEETHKGFEITPGS